MGTKTASPHGHDTANAPPDRRRHSLVGAVWLAVVLVGALIAGLTVTALGGGTPPRHTLVVASVPYWNIQHGTQVVVNNRHAVNEVSPWIYGLDSSGHIVPQFRADQTTLINSDISQMRAGGARIVPSLANVTNFSFAYPPVAGILHNPALMAQQVSAIVGLVEANHYAGIDIDFEDLHAGDRQALTTFCDHLAQALHAHGKLLSVALFAKTSNAGSSPTNAAQDYHAIGQVADQVRLMGYDYHWATSPPGPVAPVSWLRDVLNYAKTQIPPDKIVLGVPLYGYDWSNGFGTGVSWLDALRLTRQYHAQLHYDAKAQAPWFSYTDTAGHKHTVWFENAESSRAKFEVAQGAGIGGVYLWMFGYEDTGTWSAVHQVLPASQPRSLPTPEVSP